jgi:hypothetical protein
LQKKEEESKMRIFMPSKIILAATFLAICISVATAEQENQTNNHATILGMYNISGRYSDTSDALAIDGLPSWYSGPIPYTTNMSNTPGIFDIPGLSNLASDTANANIVLLPNMTVNIIVIQNMTINNILAPALGVMAKSPSDITIEAKNITG